MSNYKSLLSEFGSSKTVTQEMIDRCHANEAANMSVLKTKKTPTTEQRQKRLDAKKCRRATKHGMSFEQWEKQARTYYTIDAAFVVTSNARSPETSPETWGPFADMIEAEEKVLQLMDYKYSDHFIKGHDFAW